MSLAVREATDIVRVLLGDLNDAEPDYPLEGVDRAVRAGVRLLLVAGLQLNPCRSGVVRQDGSDPTATEFALLCYKIARQYVASQPDRYEFAMRALRERFGGWSNLLLDLEERIHDLENGSMFDSWQQLNAFLEGNRGLKLGYVATRMVGQYPHREQQYPTPSGGNGGVQQAPMY